MKKTKSTFERIMEDTKQKESFEKEYANFLLSELLLDAMSEQDISVRALSKASGISTSVIQNLRAMQPVNITLKTLNALLSSLGYELVARKGRRCVSPPQLVTRAGSAVVCSATAKSKYAWSR